MEPLVTVAELAARLKVSQKTVRRLVAAGKIGSVRIRRSVRFTENDVEAFLKNARKGEV